MNQGLRKALARAKRIRLLLMDVDGVLTDGKLYYVPDPHVKDNMIEMKGFDVTDGQGLRSLLGADPDFKIGLISVGESPGVAYRARFLGIHYCCQGCDPRNKVGSYEEILAKAGLQAEEVCYVGDDLTNVPIMKRVGLAIAVANARPEVKAIADYTTRCPGGAGAIREVAELLLQAQGKWGQVLKQYGL